MLEEELDMSEWQPIETAPKQAGRILLYRDGRVVCGQWHTDQYAKNPKPYWTHDLIDVFGIRDARSRPPTDWMPLPDPPKMRSVS
jgi:hypothetical protein